MFYYELPESYVWVKVKGGHHYWTGRKRDSTLIGQLHKVCCSPKPFAQERFYLRVLLLHVKGAMSFDDLKRVPGHNNDQPYATFKEAVFARNLLHDDAEHLACLRDASVGFSARKLRTLFVFLLSLGTMHDGFALYDGFKQYFLADLSERYTPEQAEHLLFLEFSRLSVKFNFEFESLPWVVRPEGELDLPLHIFDQDIDPQLMYQRGLTDRDRLNADQRAIFDAIVDSLTNPNGRKCFVIKGKAGTGKTFLYSALYNYLTGLGLKVLCVAYSGIAASLLPKGQTAHSAFNFRLDMDEHNYASGMHLQSKRAQLIRDVDVIIWDEISMVPHWFLSSLDQLLRDVTGRKNDLFGGKLIVVGGDFHQLLPVMKGAPRTDVVNACVSNFRYWGNFSQFHLNTIVRCTDVAHNEFVNRVGAGTIGENVDVQKGEIAVPIARSYLFPSSDPNSFIDHFYPHHVLSDHALLSQTMIIASTHADCDYINAQVLSKIPVADPSHERIYDSFDEVSRDGHLHSDFCAANLNSIDVNGFPPHRLHLKVGSVVMLLRNYATALGLTNGTRFIVTGLADRFIYCKRIGPVPPGADEIVELPRIPLIIRSDDSGLELDFKRTQFPVRLAFSITIHKSQGQTVDSLGIFLRTQVFTHGALYVALSRPRFPDRIKIFTGADIDENSDSVITIKNIVWPEVL